MRNFKKQKAVQLLIKKEPTRTSQLFFKSIFYR